MKSRKKTAYFLALTAALFLGGCARPVDSGTEVQTEASAIVDYTCISKPESEKKLYVILKNYHGTYWEKVIDGVQSAADQTDAAIYLGGIDNETDISGQIALMDQAVEDGADGILLAPASSGALIESCQQVQEQGIPLVLIDSSINSGDYDCCYMTDNMEAGKLAAEEMLTQLQAAGHSVSTPLEVGILLSSDTSQAMVNRVSGFLDYWANYAPSRWDIAEDIFRNGGDLQKAQEDAESLLQQHPAIKGLFGCNNTSTVGIVNALSAKGRTDVAMVGFDLSSETLDFIQNPDYHGASLMQRQDEMGYRGILSLDSLINDGTPEQKYIDTGVSLIDADYLMEHTIS